MYSLHFSIRAIFHDEQGYPEPFKFDPDRFENEDKNKLAGINELPHAAFGFARRWVITSIYLRLNIPAFQSEFVH